MELIYCFCLVSLILIVSGLYRLLYYNYAKKNYSVVIGKIGDFEELNTSDFHSAKYPLIHYVVNGHTYKKRGSGSVIIGKPIKVYYNPSDPFKCVLEGDNGFLLIFFGLIFLIIPAIIFFNK